MESVENKILATLRKCGRGTVCPPSVDDIAMAIAKRDKVKIAPTAFHAQNLLGMSQQTVMNYLYMTDGRTRTLKLENGGEITFKHTAAKNLAFVNRLSMLITYALKDYGADGVTEEHRKRIKELLPNEKREEIEKDYQVMPIIVPNF